MTTLTVGMLKKALANVEDSLVIAAMLPANQYELRLFTPKRFLLGINKYGEKFLIINTMGTHFDEKWQRENNEIQLKSYIEVDNNKIIKI